MFLKIGDEVEVIMGNYKGVRGEVQRILSNKNKVVVSGVQIVKKHQKPRQSRSGSPIQGGIIEFEAPIDASNVMLICPKTKRPTRIGFRRDDTGHQIRYAKCSGEDID